MSIIATADAFMLGHWPRRSRIDGDTSPPKAPVYVLVGALCVALALLNLPGEPQQPCSSGPWVGAGCDIEIRHGWPLIFALRCVHIPEDSMDFDQLLKSTNVWALGVGLTGFSLVALVADLAVAAIGVVAAARVVLWLQGLGWPRQFTVRTLLVAMLANAVLCACLCDGGRTEPPLRSRSSIIVTRESRCRGPAWLRQILGAWPFSPFDKTVGLCLLCPEQRLAFTLADVHDLSVFSNLEAVTLIGFDLPEDATNQLALLPHLKSIRIDNCTVPGKSVLGVPVERSHYARDGQYLLVWKRGATVLARYSSPD